MIWSAVLDIDVGMEERRIELVMRHVLRSHERMLGYGVWDWIITDEYH